MGLLDIAPPEIVTRQFEIRGGTLVVQGIKTRDWAALVHRFPELRRMLSDTQSGEDVMLTAINGLVPAIIAAGLQALGDEVTESLIVERLSDSEQLAIYGEIMQLTAPVAELEKSPLLVSPEKVGPMPNGSAEPQTTNLNEPSFL